jgi:hypothetical protein
MTKIKVDRYCSEANILDTLKDDCINLICASTGSGKTKMCMDWATQDDKKVGFVAPFVSITNQVKLDHPDMDIQTGTKAEEQEVYADGRITSFHSIPRMLELKELDILIIDEIHILSSYAGYTYGMLTTFWNTIEKLKEKHPKMKIVALTGTPQFVRLYPYFNFNMIEIEPRIQLSKPSKILVSKSWTKELTKEKNYLYLYASRKQGAQQAKRYNGVFIDSASKDRSMSYHKILEGQMPSNRVFTSTVLSTGISIKDPVDTIYTNWLDLISIVQMSARARVGNHKLKVTKTVPFFLKDGMDKPELEWTGDFEKDMKILNKYETWYSYMAHSGDINDLFSIIYQMIWLPLQELPTLDEY